MQNEVEKLFQVESHGISESKNLGGVNDQNMVEAVRNALEQSEPIGQNFDDQYNIVNDRNLILEDLKGDMPRMSGSPKP